MSRAPAADAPSDGGAETEDALLGGRLVLRQLRRGHRFGHDAVLLAAATGSRAGERVVELGAGVGAAGLAVALRKVARQVDLVEIDPHLVALAAANAQRNGLGPVVCHALDVGAPAAAFAAAGLPPSSIDRVMMNPPFHADAQHQASPDAARQRAHVAPEGLLAVWMKTARRLLRPGGTVTLILRADALGAALEALSTGFGGVRIVPVHAAADRPAIRVLISACKGSRAPLSLAPPLVLAGAGASPILEAVFAGTALLPLAD